MPVITTAGPTYRISAGNTTSTAVVVSSDVPVNAWQFLNDGGQPIQVKFFTGNSTATAFVSFPVLGGPGVYDASIQHAVDNQILYLPNRLEDDCADQNGFTSTIVVAAIAESGTQGLFITPVQVPYQGSN